MKYLLFAFKLLIFFSLLSCEKSHAQLEHYILKYKSIPHRGFGICKEARLYSDSISNYGAKAIPYLIEMLEHKEWKIRDRASYTLSSIDGLNETHLDQLIKALKNDHTWHAYQLVRIGNEKAIIALLEQLKLQDDCSNQIVHAYSRLSEKGIPYLIELLKCSGNCKDIPYRAIECVFHELAEKGLPAFQNLSDIAFSEEYAIKSRQTAIYCLAEIGSIKNNIEERLYSLSIEDSTNFHFCVFNTLAKLKSKYSLDSFLDLLKNAETEFDRKLILRDIAEMGESANSLGFEIQKYYQSRNWDTRLAVINTLGYIKHKPSINLILEALNNKSDVRLTYVAIRSIYNINLDSTKKYLINISDNHWYDYIRSFARKAVSNFNMNDLIKDNRSHNFASEYFSINDIGEYKKCEKIDQFSKSLTLGVKDGELIGVNHGEFGGELIYKSKDGKESQIIKDNITSIFKFHDRIVVIAGLAHLTTDEGTIYLVSKDVNNNYTHKIIAKLPSVPVRYKIKDDNMILFTYKGIISIDKDYNFRMLDCEDVN